MVREKVYSMEQTHLALKAKYEYHFLRLEYLLTQCRTDMMKKFSVCIASSKLEEVHLVRLVSVARRRVLHHDHLILATVQATCLVV